MKDVLLLDVLAGLIAFVMWLNWQSGHIEALINYILKHKKIKLSAIGLLILVLPLFLHYTTNFISSETSIQKSIQILAPATLLIAIAKDYIDRKRIKNALHGELLLNYRNLKHILTAYDLTKDSNARKNLHKSLKNQWMSTVYDRYVDQIVSGNVIHSREITIWTDIYQNMKAAVDYTSSSEENEMCNDFFLFEYFIGDSDNGVVADIEKLLQDFDQDKVAQFLSLEK